MPFLAWVAAVLVVAFGIPAIAAWWNVRDSRAPTRGEAATGTARQSRPTPPPPSHVHVFEPSTDGAA